MDRILTIDGHEFPNIVITNLERSFQVLDGQNAGRLLSGRMERDIIGTFYNYSCSIDGTAATREEYDEFYEIISAPADSHIVNLPYGQSILRFEAYVTNGKDKIVGIYDDGTDWTGLQFNFIAMAPQRY